METWACAPSDPRVASEIRSGQVKGCAGSGMDGMKAKDEKREARA